MTSPQDISPAEKRRELDSLLATVFVKEQTHLRALLEYLGRKAIDEPGQAVKEFTIGVEALGKADDYDPRIDPTVRVGIGRLRTKLAEHYDSPAAGGSVRIDIPKGQYQLAFSVRQHSAAPPESGVWTGRVVPAVAMSLVGFVVGILATLLLPSGNRLTTGELAPELRAFWRSHLEPSKPTLVVYGTPLLIKLDRWLLRDSRVNRWDDLPRAEGLSALLASVPGAVPEPGYEYTGSGEADGVFLVTRLLAPRVGSLAVKRSATLNWDDFRDTHVVLLGSHKFNRQLADLPYELKYMPMSRPSRLANTRPAPGEPAAYTTVFGPGRDTIAEEYAVVSSLPGIGPNTHMTVLSAPSSDGTAAAAEFVTRADTLRLFLDRLHRDRLSLDALPSAFQVVIRVRMKDGVAVQFDYVTHHVMTNGR